MEEENRNTEEQPEIPQAISLADLVGEQKSSSIETAFRIGLSYMELAGRGDSPSGRILTEQEFLSLVESINTILNDNQ